MSEVINACFIGHKVKFFCEKYDLKGENFSKMRNDLIMVIEDLIINKKVTGFICDGEMGVGTVVFYTVHYLKRRFPHIKNFLAINFKEHTEKWGFKNKKVYNEMISLADRVIYVDTLKKYKIKDAKEGEFHFKKSQMRNQCMIDCSNYTVIIYCEGEKDDVFYSLKHASFKEKKIIKLDANRYKYNDGKYVVK